MKRQNSFDSLLTKTLSDLSSPVSASEQLKVKIDRQIDQVENKEDISMKQISKKKWAAIAAVVVLFSSITVGAAGKITSLITHSTPDSFHSYDSYSKMKKAEKELGYAVKDLETFSNGYAFSKMEIEVTDALDDSGNVVTSYPELSITYLKQDLPKVRLYVRKPVTKDTLSPQKTEQYKDIPLSYSLDIYKFVPVGYELTDEDQEKMEAGHYYVSEGADEISIDQVGHVYWTEDGISYHLMNFEADVLESEELLQMAKELIDAEY